MWVCRCGVIASCVLLQRDDWFTGQPFYTITENSAENRGFNATHLLPSVTYHFRVAGVNAAGEGAFATLAWTTLEQGTARCTHHPYPHADPHAHTHT